MSKIDDLYKRAFGSKEFEYNEYGWEQMNSLLDDKLPVQGASSSWFKSFSGVAAAGLIAAVAVFSTSSEFNSNDAIAEQVTKVKSNKESVTVEEPTTLTVVKSNPSKDVDQEAKAEVASLENTTKPKEKITQTSSDVTSLMASESQLENASVQIAMNQSTEIEASVFAHEQIQPMKPAGVAFFKQTKSESLLDWSPKFSATDMVFADQKIIEPELLLSSESTSFQDISSVDPLVAMKPLELQSPEITLSLMDPTSATRKYKSLRKEVQMFVGAFGSSETIDDSKDLNIDVNPEIKNVAVVNLENSAYSAGVEAGMEWKGLTAGVGIGYAQRSSSYSLYYSHTKEWQEEHVESHTEISAVDSTVIGHQVGLIEKDGKLVMGIINTLYDVDTSYKSYNDTSFTSKSSTQTLDEDFAYKAHYMTLPVHVGYQFQLSRVSIGLSVGMNFNILTNGSGTIYQESNNQIVAFNYKDRLNPVVYTTEAAINLGYDIKPGLSVILQPKLVQSLNSTFKSDDQLASKYTGYGANLRLRYSF